jgi:hypothetical protein
VNSGVSDVKTKWSARVSAEPSDGPEPTLLAVEPEHYSVDVS